MTRIVGLSGGIGSGKSTVSRLLARLGATVIDADAIVHELQAPGAPMLAEIAASFGPDVIDAEGRLDRAAVGAIVFRDTAARQRLGAIVHPPVGAEIRRRLELARSQGVRVVVLDIPLLFEGRKQGRDAAAQRGEAERRRAPAKSGRDAGSREAGTGSGAALAFDATVLVWAPEQAQIERQIARDGCSRDEAVRRIRAQMPLHEKKALADFVIDNSGTPEETERQVRALWESLSRGAERAEAP